MDDFLRILDIVGEFTITVGNASELAREVISVISLPERYGEKARMARQALNLAREATKLY